MNEDIVIPSKTLSPKEAMLYSVKCIYDRCITLNTTINGSSYNEELVINAILILITLINNNQPLMGADTVVTTTGNTSITKIDFCQYSDVFCSINKHTEKGWVTNMWLCYPHSRSHKRGISYLDFDLGFEVIDSKPVYKPTFLSKPKLI